MNDPNNGPGQGNGLIEVWINGEKDPDLCNYQLRYTTADTIGINRLWADIHYGGKYQSPADNTLFLDNFHVSTAPTPWSGELVGDSGWSGTLHVDGDVIVPDGVTLTVMAGTEVRFAAGSDGTGGGSDASRSELIVEGTLHASARNITFRSSNNDDTTLQGDYAWGGIRIMPGGSASLDNAQIRDMAPPPSPPTSLTAEAGDGQVTLEWEDAYPKDPSITGWEYRTRVLEADLADDVGWGSWTEVSGGADMREVTVGSLAHGEMHQFQVHAVNSTGGGPTSDVASVALMTVAFSAGSYSAIESGNPVGPEEVRRRAPDPTQAARDVAVIVQVTPATDRPLTIPVTVTAGSAEAADYRVQDLPSGGLTLPCERYLASVQGDGPIRRGLGRRDDPGRLWHAASGRGARG